MNGKYWLYFTVFYHLILHSRLYNWFVKNINKFTMSYVYNEEFAILIIFVPFLVSIFLFKCGGNIKESLQKNKIKVIIYTFIEKIIMIYNVLGFAYCIVDRNFSFFSKYLFLLSKFVINNDIKNIVTVIYLIISLIIFALFKRFNK